jgi:DNA replication initiation complex subunit (GINS family)
VKIKIVLPSSLTAEERELYEKLKTLRRDDPRAYLG